MKAIRVTMPANGFHALFAKQLSGAATTYISEIRIIWEERNIISDVKSILGLMALETGKGTVLTLTFHGPDEDQAIAIAKLFDAEA
ncbi:HPr family phosphocarrier protein [Paenibacillus chitinolyticus]